MVYKFRSKASGDTLMLGPQGDHLLTLIGREPAARGIIEPPDRPAAILALQRAADEDDARRAGVPEAEEGAAGRDPIALRRRIWPMVEMMRRAHAANEPIVWGV
jgi:hypothetical protein